MGWRDTKDAARLVVHSTFQQDARYTTTAGLKSRASVRVLRRDTKFGNYDGIGYADVAAAPVELVFLMSELPSPQVGATVELATGEQFRVDNVLEPDYPIIKCEAHPF